MSDPKTIAEQVLAIEGSSCASSIELCLAKAYLNLLQRSSAFPAPWGQVGERGMSLRDYFAARAMQTMDYLDCSDEIIAEKAYRLADAMLKAREQTEIRDD